MPGTADDNARGMGNPGVYGARMGVNVGDILFAYNDQRGDGYFREAAEGRFVGLAIQQVVIPDDVMGIVLQKAFQFRSRLVVSGGNFIGIFLH